MGASSLKLPGLLLVLVVFAAACNGGGEEPTDTQLPGGDDVAGDQQEPQGDGQGGTLQRVRDRGTLRCGVNDSVPGFGFTDAEGNFSGFDVDLCKVIAAAVLGDPEAVEFQPLTAETRFTALQGREIDVLSRNTTWTATRDGAEGAAFVTTTFYDGQGMMVPADSQFQQLEDMQNTAICVLSGTTTEFNLASQFGARGITYEPVSFEDNDVLQEAFQQQRCDGWTSDKSQLAAVRSAWPAEQGGPEALRILDETMSKEPLGPVVLDGDQQWFDVVNWAVIATIQAEEFGITSQNIDEKMETEDPEIRRFLGLPGIEDDTEFDAGLGLDAKFAVNIIRGVGNYAEIYDANVGPDTPLGLERGLNALYTNGGILYPPPYK